MEKVHQLFAAHTDDAGGYHRLDRGQCLATVEAGGIVARKLALEREPSDVFPVIADAIRYILEAPFGDEAEPSCGVALALRSILFFPNFCSITDYSRLKIYTQFFCSFFDFLHNLQASSAGDADIRTNGYQVLVRRKSFEINGCSMFAKGIIIGQVICWS